MASRPPARLGLKRGCSTASTIGVRLFSAVGKCLSAFTDFTRMMFAVRLFQVGDCQPQVTLGGRQRFVSEHFLNVPQVRIIFEQVRRATVPPQVAGDVLFDARPLRIFFHERAQRIFADGTATQ